MASSFTDVRDFAILKAPQMVKGASQVISLPNSESPSRGTSLVLSAPAQADDSSEQKLKIALNLLKRDSEVITNQMFIRQTFKFGLLLNCLEEVMAAKYGISTRDDRDNLKRCFQKVVLQKAAMCCDKPPSPPAKRTLPARFFSRLSGRTHNRNTGQQESSVTSTTKHSQFFLIGTVSLPFLLGKAAVRLDSFLSKGVVRSLTGKLSERASVWEQVTFKSVYTKYPRLVFNSGLLTKGTAPELLKRVKNGEYPLFEATFESEGVCVSVVYLQEFVRERTSREKRHAQDTTSKQVRTAQSLSHQRATGGSRRREYKRLIDAAHVSAVDRMEALGLWKA